MKLRCDRCQSRYQIPDSAVSGRAVRMKCRKCGHLIVAERSPGVADSPEPPAPAVEDKAPRAADRVVSPMGSVRPVPPGMPPLPAAAQADATTSSAPEVTSRAADDVRGGEPATDVSPAAEGPESTSASGPESVSGPTPNSDLASAPVDVPRSVRAPRSGRRFGLSALALTFVVGSAAGYFGKDAIRAKVGGSRASASGSTRLPALTPSLVRTLLVADHQRAAAHACRFRVSVRGKDDWGYYERGADMSMARCAMVLESRGILVRDSCALESGGACVFRNVLPGPNLGARLDPDGYLSFACGVFDVGSVAVIEESGRSARFEYERVFVPDKSILEPLTGVCTLVHPKDGPKRKERFAQRDDQGVWTLLP